MVSYAFPGDEEPREISLAGVLREPRCMLMAPPAGAREAATTAAAYDGAPRGRVTERRRFLDGNVFAAVREAMRIGLGPAVAFRDDAGRRRRGVPVPAGRSMQVAAAPVALDGPGTAFELLKANRGPVYTDPSSRLLGGLQVRRDGAAAVVTVPAGKRAAARFETPGVVAAMGRGFADCPADRRVREARVAPSCVEALLRAVADAGFPLHCDGEHRGYVASLGAAGDDVADRAAGRDDPAPAGPRAA
jgi:hypothetical protein